MISTVSIRRIRKNSNHLGKGKGGLPLKKDKRDLSHSRLVGMHNMSVGAVQSQLSLLPPGGLGRIIRAPRDQGDTPFCTGENTSKAISYLTGVDMSPEYQIACIGKVTGESIFTLGGADPRIAMQTMLLWGALAETLSPFILASGASTNDPRIKDPSFIAEFNNWPAPLALQSAKYEQQAYFAVDGPFDHFDNIRMALQAAFAEGQVVMMFTPWYTEYANATPQNAVLPHGVTPNGWHAWLVPDWQMPQFNPGLSETPLIVDNSWGAEWGQGGIGFMTRQEVNTLLSVPGAGAFVFRKLDANAVMAFNLHNAALSDVFLEILQRLKGGIIGLEEALSK